eukprot:1161278-Pelagomonas_calceolata.AAC.9
MGCRRVRQPAFVLRRGRPQGGRAAEVQDLRMCTYTRSVVCPPNAGGVQRHEHQAALLQRRGRPKGGGAAAVRDLGMCMYTRFHGCVPLPLPIKYKSSSSRAIFSCQMFSCGLGTVCAGIEALHESRGTPSKHGSVRCSCPLGAFDAHVECFSLPIPRQPR